MFEFIDKYINPIRIIADKKKYKLYLNRVKQLPEDYKATMEGISSYMFSTCGNESLVMEILYSTLDMFEENVALNRNVLEIIGDDLGAFCENIHKVFPESNWIDCYIKKRQNKINKKFARKMSKNK